MWSLISALQQWLTSGRKSQSNVNCICLAFRIGSGIVFSFICNRGSGYKAVCVCFSVRGQPKSQLKSTLHCTATRAFRAPDAGGIKVERHVTASSEIVFWLAVQVVFKPIDEARQCGQRGLSSWSCWSHWNRGKWIKRLVSIWMVCRDRWCTSHRRVGEW